MHLEMVLGALELLAEVVGAALAQHVEDVVAALRGAHADDPADRASRGHVTEVSHPEWYGREDVQTSTSIAPRQCSKLRDKAQHRYNLGAATYLA